MSRLLITIIKFYQYAISPLIKPSCRFSPSCAEYSCQAIGRHGAIKGGWLTIKRLGRCHPWHPGGNDPIPD